MFSPSSRTCPETRAPGTVSCMRLRQRMNVDLPQPDGPMIAVTDRSWKCIVAPRTACTAPKYASSCSTRMCSLDATGCTSARTGASALVAAIALPRRDARDRTDDENDANEDERAGPGLGVPCVVGTDIGR